ncbi:kinase-like domain-containing protein [Coprinopsis sp. MPI-PUGE-AT-0042]|nr:kinase-like domain-containing protein [Coprinopsis sp. MPI-PUGE-AT-0042]
MSTTTLDTARAPTVVLRKLSFSSNPSLLKIASLPRRSFSSLSSTESELFNYTSGRWVYNEALRLQERKLVFDVDKFMRLAAKSVDRRLSDIIDFSKLAEGDHNRIFLITFNDNFQMVARVPYPVTGPKYYGLASEVATMVYLRLSGLPIPEVYGYSPGDDNTAGIAYIFMEYVQGSSLRDVWFDLGDEEIVDVARQITQLEATMTALSFPAGGSLYFGKDLEKVGMQGVAVPLPGAVRFCIGPDARVPFWYKKRAHLDVYRGPYHSVEDALVAGAYKEIAYLKQFGRPVRPTRRQRWSSYNWKPQLPSDHIQNLERYLSITSSLIPNDPQLQRFSIGHPDLKISNIIVNSDCQIAGLIDWQHASILPLYLLAGRLKNPADTCLKTMASPLVSSDTPDSGESDNTQQESPNDLRRRQLLRRHYVKNTEECNELHYRAFTDPLHLLRWRLFEGTGLPWEGETLELNVFLLEVWQRWDELAKARGGTTLDSQCPFNFDIEDLLSSLDFLLHVKGVEKEFGSIQASARIIGKDGWVATNDYEHAKMVVDEAKEEVMRDSDATEERLELMRQWPWDDIDEETLAA